MVTPSRAGLRRTGATAGAGRRRRRRPDRKATGSAGTHDSAPRDRRVGTGPAARFFTVVWSLRFLIGGLSARVVVRSQRVPTAARTALRAIAQSSCSLRSSSRCSSPEERAPGRSDPAPAAGASRMVRWTAVS